MTRLVKAAALPALLLLIGGCQVSVDNNTQAQLDNAGDQIGAGLDKAGDAIGNTADRIGNEVEAGADKIGNGVEHGVDKVDNGVDVHVNLHGDKDDKPGGNKS
jgi:hypothetical protein